MKYTRWTVAFLFGFALLWGLYQDAAAPRQSYYRLFLFLSLPTLLVLLRLPLEWIARPHRIPLFLCGPLLLAGLLLSPMLEGRGFVVLAIGWMTWFLSVSLTSDSPSARRTLLIFLVLVGGMEAVAGLTQSLGQDDLARGTFVNRNHFAGLLNMAILLAMGGLFANYARQSERLPSETYARSWVILLSTAFMGLGILLSLSRMGTVSLILSLVFVTSLLVLKPSGARGRTKTLPAKAALILLLTVVGLGIGVGMDSLIARFGAMDNIDTQRLSLYADTLKVVAQQPFWGVGPGMYRWHIRPFQTTDAAKWPRHAHNDYLQTAVEWGVPLAVGFWVFVLWRLWRSTRLFLHGSDAWQQGIALGCAGAIFSILVHSFVDFNLQIPGNWAVFCVILGLGQTNEGTREAKPTS